MENNQPKTYINKKLLFLDFCFFLISIYLGLLIFHVDIKSIINKVDVKSTINKIDIKSIINKLSLNRSVCSRCNVILISLDTLGSNHLPCYGYNRNTAQNLCRFANDNILFTNSFSNASWTLPSHFSIFTSLYPNHHNMLGDESKKLNSSISTMAEFFKKADYKTIYAGPLDDPYLPLNKGIERGFDTISDSLSPYTLESWDEAIAQLIKDNSQKRSTFLFLHTYWVHAPYFVNDILEANDKRIFTNDSYPDIPLSEASYSIFTKEFMDYLIESYSEKIKEDNGTDKKIYQDIVDGLKGARNITEAEKIYNNLIPYPAIRGDDLSTFYFNQINKSSERAAYAKSLYDERIYSLDKKLSMIFDLVSNKELANNTIIIVTSDHGEEFMEHGTISHPADHLYNTTTSVPLIMYVPGIKQRKIDSLVQGVDILPTILTLTGLKDSKNRFDGIDLTDNIRARKQFISNKYVISEGPNDSIRDNRWKLYVNYPEGEDNLYELYDLYNDPQEKNNFASQEPKIIKKLRDNLNRIIYKK